MALSVALVGGGIWAREEHLPAIQASEHLRLRAVYSRSLRSAHAIASQVPGIDVYSDDSNSSFDDLLQRSDIKAVVIADFIRAALVAGKHVLSEKPVAENLKEAAELIAWYRENHSINASWHVAENWRFLASVAAAKGEVSKLGRVLGFNVRISDNIQKGWKFFETEWRKIPTHQGGFLLDGGVHYVAGLRRLLESQSVSNKITRVSAFTTLLQDHLPPVDTINAILELQSGVAGTYQQSVGTSLTGSEWTIACDRGVATVADSKVTIRRGDDVEEMLITDERTGVPPVIRAWAEGLVKSNRDQDLEPEEAIADLELIELMLRSGEHGGTSMLCKYQEIKE